MRYDCASVSSLLWPMDTLSCGSPSGLHSRSPGGFKKAKQNARREAHLRDPASDPTLRLPWDARTAVLLLLSAPAPVHWSPSVCFPSICFSASSDCSRVWGLRVKDLGGFSGSPVVKTQCFHCRGHRFDPWSGNPVCYMVWPYPPHPPKKKCRIWVWIHAPPHFSSLQQKSQVLPFPGGGPLLLVSLIPISARFLPPTPNRRCSKDQQWPSPQTAPLISRLTHAAALLQVDISTQCTLPASSLPIRPPGNLEVTFHSSFFQTLPHCNSKSCWVYLQRTPESIISHALLSPSCLSHQLLSPSSILPSPPPPCTPAALDFRLFLKHTPTWGLCSGCPLGLNVPGICRAYSLPSLTPLDCCSPRPPLPPLPTTLHSRPLNPVLPFLSFYLISLLFDIIIYWGFPGGSNDIESFCNAGDPSSIPGSGRFLGEGNGHSLQYSCLENPMDRGGRWATVHGVTKSHTGPSN